MWLLFRRVLEFPPRREAAASWRQQTVSVCGCCAFSVSVFARSHCWWEFMSLQASGCPFLCYGASIKKRKKNTWPCMCSTYCSHINALIHLHRSVQREEFISGTLDYVGEKKYNLTLKKKKKKKVEMFWSVLLFFTLNWNSFYSLLSIQSVLCFVFWEHYSLCVCSFTHCSTTFQVKTWKALLL